MVGLKLIRKPAERIVTKRQLRRKLRLERYLRKLDRSYKVKIFRSLFFSIQFTKGISYKQIFLLNIKNFIYYLLDKLKEKSNIDYFIYFSLRSLYIKNCERNSRYINFLLNDFFLYKLLWKNCNFKYFYNFDKEIEQFFSYKKKIIQNKNLISKYFSYKIYYNQFYFNLIKNFCFENSLLILLFEYLNEINLNFSENLISNKSKKKKFIIRSLLKKVRITDIDFLSYVYRNFDFNDEKFKDYDFLEEKSSYKENYTMYFKYIDNEDRKTDIILFPLRSSFLSELYLEEILLEELNIFQNPFFFINIVDFENYLQTLNIQSFEKNFQLKLAKIHNENLNFLNIKEKKFLNIKEKDQKKEINFQNFYIIKNFEESKIYSDIFFELNFFQKTCFQLIELSLFKFKDFFSMPFLDLIRKLYDSVDTQCNLILFYNLIVNEFQNKITMFTLNDIIFIIEFLEFLFILCRNINRYTFNVFNFNIYKLKLIIGDIRFLKKNFYKRLFFFRNEKNYNYVDYLFSLYSTKNIFDNFNHYFNFYNFFFSNSINLLFEEGYSFFKRFRRNYQNKYLDPLLDIKKKKPISDIYFMLLRRDLRFLPQYKKRKFGKFFINLNSIFFDRLDTIVNSNISNKSRLYTLDIYSIQNTYKYNYLFMTINLNNSFINLINMDLLHFNIENLKKNILKFETHFFLINKEIITFIFNYYKLDSFNIYNYNIWFVLINKNAFKFFKDIYVKKQLFDLIFIYLFSSLMVHFTHALDVIYFLKKYKSLITIYQEKRQKVKNQKKVEIKREFLEIAKKMNYNENYFDDNNYFIKI